MMDEFYSISSSIYTEEKSFITKWCFNLRSYNPQHVNSLITDLSLQTSMSSPVIV